MRTIEEILSAGDYISGETISRELNITRAAVWKRIEALRAEGWEIESGGKRGYRLIAGDSLQPALWQGRLRTQALGRGVRHPAGGIPHGVIDDQGPAVACKVTPTLVGGDDAARVLAPDHAVVRRDGLDGQLHLRHLGQEIAHLLGIQGMMLA